MDRTFTADSKNTSFITLALLCSQTCCTTIVWSSAWSSDGPRIMPVTDPELCHGTPYAFRRYGCAVSRARTLQCFPPPARVLAPSLLSFRPTLRSSLSAPGRMHEHTSADGLRVLRLQNRNQFLKLL